MLALRRVFTANTGLPSLLSADDVARNGDVDLVFVTPTDRAGFANELDLVAGNGRVTLYRYLGQGFAEVPTAGSVVTYVPGWTEKNGPFSSYDQVLIGYSGGSWRVFSEQYVPIAAALAPAQGGILGQPGGPRLIALREAGALPGPASRGIGRAEIANTGWLISFGSALRPGGRDGEAVDKVVERVGAVALHPSELQAPRRFAVKVDQGFPQVAVRHWLARRRRSNPLPTTSPTNGPENN